MSKAKMFAAAMMIMPCLAAGGQAANQTETVKFKPGTSFATLKGSVTGYDTHSYVLGASAGQTISVLFAPSKNLSCYFNFIEPGADSAIHMGEVAGNEYAATLTKTGNYRAEAYLMRNDARRGKTCKYSITFEITGPAKAAAPTVDGTEDAKVEGTNFNATGEIPCARDAGQPMGSCKYGVEREGNGKGAVTIFWPDGGSRVIFFEGGQPAFYNESQADGGAKMSFKQDADLFRISIGKQRYEIPDAVINGG